MLDKIFKQEQSPSASFEAGPIGGPKWFGKNVRIAKSEKREFAVFKWRQE